MCQEKWWWDDFNEQHYENYLDPVDTKGDGLRERGMERRREGREEERVAVMDREGTEK